MKKLFPLFIAVILIVVLAVPAFAAVVTQYSYNGVVLPKPPSRYSESFIYSEDGTYYFVTSQFMSASADGDIDLSGSGYWYILQDDEWVKKNTYDGPVAFGKVDVLWTANDLGPYVGSEPVITQVEVPDPPPEPITVGEFMSSAGQILTSAISWVGDVGSTILQQPLLLAFCALPLCGIGIGIFKRLKTAS